LKTDSPKAKLNEYSIESAQLQAEKTKQKGFQDIIEDQDTASTESSRRNSILNEPRPTAEIPVHLQDLLACHFGQNYTYNSAPFKSLDQIGRQCDACYGYELGYFMPLKDQLLKDYCSLEKVLVLVNLLLFATSFQCAEVDSDVSNALIYIMYAIAYFVITTTFLSGAASIRNLFKSEGNRRTDDCHSSMLSNNGNAKPVTGLANKKPSAKKPVVPLLKAEKKELQMNNFYQNAKRTR